MKITAIDISVFELPIRTSLPRNPDLDRSSSSTWQTANSSSHLFPVEVIHVKTDDGVEGVCTVGDWQYTQMLSGQLDLLRKIAIGENPLDRNLLYGKLKSAARFFDQAWFGGFDNCLWDIAGKTANVPVAKLLGGAREQIPAYYNFTGESLEELILDGERAIEQGFTVLKDHLPYQAEMNIELFSQLRKAFGNKVGLMHDAALTSYSYEEALKVGKALETENFIWLEEPLPDRQMENYVRLADALDIPIAGAETLMHDPEIGALWLQSRAVDILRVNGRHGTTPLVKLANFAEMQNKTVEPNALGPLFGLVHAHINCGLSNINWFEVSPPFGGATMAKEIGLLNPPVPKNGYVTYPKAPGWGASWDWELFESKRVAKI